MHEKDEQENSPKWKQWTEDRNVSPPITGSNQYDSEEAARRAARDKMKMPHTAVLYIEKPDGSQIELDAIKR